MNSLFGFCNKALLTLREPLFPFAQPSLVGNSAKPWSDVAAVTHTLSPAACQVELSLQKSEFDELKGRSTVAPKCWLALAATFCF